MHIVKAEKSDKKALKRFFKSQGYPASFIGFDKSYVVKNSQQVIIAAVIISTVGQVEFLHGLCVDGLYRHQQLASKLLHHCCSQHLPILCFADQSLSTLYTKNGFKRIAIDAIEPLLQYRWQSYFNKNGSLKVFRFG